MREVFGQSGAVTLQEQSEILGDLVRKNIEPKLLDVITVRVSPDYR